MMNLIILLFVGFTSAVLQEDFQNEAKHAVTAFMNGLQTATPLHTALGIEDSEDVQRLERDIKEELKKHIEDAFEKALKQIEDAVADNKKVNEQALQMLGDLKKMMKYFNVNDDELTEGIEDLKAKVDKHLRMILEKMGIFDKRSAGADPDLPDMLQSVFWDGSIKELLLKLKDMILEKLNVKNFKEAIVKIIGQVTQRLCDWLTSKGKEKVLNMLDNLFDSDPGTEKRASEDRFQEVKDYLKNIEENAKDKLARFKKWVHDLLDKGINEAKEKVQKVAEILKDIIAEGKIASKKELEAILEHIQEYEDKFGSLYDLRDVIQKILKNKY